MSDNELIAEFMGRDWQNEFKWIENEDKPGQRIEVPLDFCDLLYDRSWNWLMPVIEKIENLDIMHSCQIYSNCCAISVFNGGNNPSYKYQVTSVGASKIDAVYKAVVDFIKWRNSQNK